MRELNFPILAVSCPFLRDTCMNSILVPSIEILPSFYQSKVELGNALSKESTVPLVISNISAVFSFAPLM